MSNLIECLEALLEYLPAIEWEVPIMSVEAVHEAIRAVKAWEIAVRRQWKAAPFPHAGKTAWHAVSADGGCQPGPDHPDPITAMIEADAILAKLEQ